MKRCAGVLCGLLPFLLLGVDRPPATEIRPFGTAPLICDGTAKTFHLPVTGGPSNEMTVAFRFKADADTPVFPEVRHVNGCFAFAAGRGFAWFEATGANRRVYDGCAHPWLLETGVWHDAAFTFDQTGLAVYWGGRCVKRCPAPDLGPLKQGTRLIRVGHRFKGVITDFRILTRACSEFPAERARAARRQPQPRFDADGLDVWTASALAWVRPEDRSWARPAEALTFDTAANERESRQVFVYPARAAKRLTVTRPARLKTGSGKSASFDLTVRQIVYRPVSRASYYLYNVGTTFPDRLEERAFFTRGDEPCFSLWMDVKTPPGTPAGRYRGEVVFADETGARTTRLVEVNVRGFELPVRNTVPTLMNIWDRDVMEFAVDDPRRFLDLMRAYCEILLDHRLNPRFLHEPDLIKPPVIRALYPIVRFGEDGRDMTNWGPWDELVAHCRARGMSAIAVGPTYRTTNDWLTARSESAAVWQAWRNHVKEKGWLEDAIAYPIDEWGERSLPLMRQIGETVHASAPEFRWIVTGGNGNLPQPDALAGVDIWCPQIHYLNRTAQRQVQAAGGAVWHYVCTGPQFPMPNLHGDTPLAAIRVVPVAGIRFGMDGFLHWGVNFNTGRGKKPIHAYGFAEGQYVYPDDEGRPVPTCRLRALGDGMEDWMAADLLRRRDAAAWARLATRLAALIPEKEYDPSTPISWHAPDRASHQTFLPIDAFYGLYGRDEKYLAWRAELYTALEAVFR